MSSYPTLMKPAKTLADISFPLSFPLPSYTFLIINRTGNDDSFSFQFCPRLTILSKSDSCWLLGT
jgi:hypothetical protein